MQQLGKTLYGSILSLGVLLASVVPYLPVEAGPFLLHKRKAFQSSPAYDYEESYDNATDYDLTWVETGTPLPNTADPDTTGPFTNECLLLDDNADEVYISVTGAGSYNVFTLFHWTGTFADTRAFLIFQDSSGTNLAEVRSRTTGGDRLSCLAVGGTANHGSFALSAGTSYYLWADYTKGTGTDATINVYVASTATKPAADCSSTNGTSTADIGRIKLDSGATNYDTYFDKTIIHSSTIGSDPWP